MKLVKLIALASLFVLAACSNSTTGTVSFSLTTRRATGALAPAVAAAGDSTVIALAPDTVVVRSAQLVLRKVELKRADAVSCDAGIGACEDFETGSKLLTLPLGSTLIAQDVSIPAPAGVYNEVEFEVHKPNSTDDATFIAANPDFAVISIRVIGTFVHGTGAGAGTRSDFTFTSDVDQSQKASLVPRSRCRTGRA